MNYKEVGRRPYFKAFFSLFVVALLTRIFFYSFFLADNPCVIMYDAGHYHQLATRIVQGLGYTDTAGNAYFYRLPGYPFFVAIGYWLFNNLGFTLMMQIVLASCIPFLIFVLAYHLNRCYTIAFIAGLIGCFHLGFIIFSGLLMSESLFMLFFLLFLICFLPLSTRPATYQCSYFVGGGVFLGCASLIRPVGHVLLIPIALLLMMGERGSISKKIQSFSYLFFAWFSVISPWLVRNWMLTGYFFFHTLPGVHFLNHSAIRLCAAQEYSSYEQAKKNVNQALKQRMDSARKNVGRPLLAIEECLLAEGLAKHYITKNWRLTIMHWLENVIKTIGSLYSSELLVIDGKGVLPSYEVRSWKDTIMRFLKPQVGNKAIRWVIYFEIIMQLLMWVGVFLFIIYKAWRRDFLFCFISFFLLGSSFIAMSLACGFARLRLPIEPFLIIMSTWGYYSFASKYFLNIGK